MTDPRGNTTVFRVDGADRQTETIDAKGVRVSRVVYNDNDLRDEVRIAPPEGVAPDADGLIRSRRFGYNLRNELKTATDFFGRFVTSFYDADSTVVRIVDEKGVPREFVPDELDRTMEERVQIRPGTVAITAFHYDARGNRDRVTDPRGQTWLFDHDAASRLFRLTYPAIVTGPQPGASHVETWTYNDHGEPATHTDALGDQAAFGYDAMGRSTTETHVLGAQVRAALVRAYDGASNLVSAFDAVTGLAVEYQTPLGTPGYDALNRLTDVRFRVGGTIFKSLHYGYDAASNRDTMTGPDGETIAYSHDKNNRMETLRRNGALFGTWVYDSGGRLKETQLGNGAVARRTYDGKEQVRSVRTLTSGGALLAGYAYDYNERGERTQMIAEHLGTTAAYGYTDNSWLSSEIYTGALASSRSYEYDLGGNRTRAIRDGVACTYSHDEENRLFLERCAAGAGGQLFGTPVASSTKPGHSAAVLADGDTADSPSAKKCWRNDEKTPGLIFAGLDFGAAKSVNEVRFFIPTLEGNEGAAGMQRFKVQVGDGTTFTDAIPTALQGAESSPTPGWLRTVKPTPHEVRVEFVPLTGKIVRILMDLGPSDQPKTMRLNEIQAFGPAEETIQYFYDANGSQTKRAKGSIEETLAYDYRNLLTNYTRKNTSTNAIQSAFMYGFMPTGERLSKMDVLSGATTWSMYDGADVVSDYTTTPTAPLFSLSASYVNALGIDSKVAHINPNGDRFFYTSDALGSATQLVNASQAVVNSYFTTAWGEDLINQRPVADRYGFTQRERDDESSLMHFRARSYDPRLGRFTQKDPVLRNRITEHYAYAGNNPVMRMDPTGLDQDHHWFPNQEGIKAYYDELFGKGFDNNRFTSTLADNVHGLIHNEDKYNRELLSTLNKHGKAGALSEPARREARKEFIEHIFRTVKAHRVNLTKLHLYRNATEETAESFVDLMLHAYPGMPDSAKRILSKEGRGRVGHLARMLEGRGKTTGARWLRGLLKAGPALVVFAALSGPAYEEAYQSGGVVGVVGRAAKDVVWYDEITALTSGEAMKAALDGINELNAGMRDLAGREGYNLGRIGASSWSDVYKNWGQYKDFSRVIGVTREQAQERAEGEELQEFLNSIKP